MKKEELRDLVYILVFISFVAVFFVCSYLAGKKEGIKQSLPLRTKHRIDPVVIISKGDTTFVYSDTDVQFFNE